MLLRRLAVLTVLLASAACAPERVVVTDDEVPLTAPLEADEDLPEAVPGTPQQDPPGRPIRLSYVDGGVTRQPAGLDVWAQAGVNQPLGPGDNLWVPAGARAELHAGATGLRVAPGTGLEILHLDDHALQLGLPRGSVELRIQPGRDADTLEIDTPDSTVLLDHPGTYRVDVDPDGAFDRVTVRQGQADVTAEDATIPVEPGSCLELTAGETPHYDMLAALDPDGFDRWCGGRDQREDLSESALYVGRDVTGFEDLDGHGTW